MSTPGRQISPASTCKQLTSREETMVQRFALGLTVMNLVLLSLILPRALSSSAQSVNSLLRARVLELVDQDGRVRSRLNIERDGEVVFRMLDENGTIRVKLGAGEHGSGLVLLDETTEPGVHLLARRSSTGTRPGTTSLTLRVDAQTRIIKP
jgi:hypothetical protein